MILVVLMSFDEDDDYDEEHYVNDSDNSDSSDNVTDRDKVDGEDEENDNEDVIVLKMEKSKFTRV